VAKKDDVKLPVSEALSVADIKALVKDFYAVLETKDQTEKVKKIRTFFDAKLRPDQFRWLWAMDRRSVVPHDFSDEAFKYTWNVLTDGSKSKVAAKLGITEKAVQSIAANRIKRPFKDGVRFAIAMLTKMVDKKPDDDEQIAVDKEGKPKTVKVSVLRARMEKMKKDCEHCDANVLKNTRKRKDQMTVDESMTFFQTLVDQLG